MRCVQGFCCFPVFSGGYTQGAGCTTELSEPCWKRSRSQSSGPSIPTSKNLTGILSFTSIQNVHPDAQAVCIHESTPKQSLIVANVSHTIHRNQPKKEPQRKVRATIYFLAAAASSAFSFARLSRLPWCLASLLASRNFLYAPPSTASGSSLFLISLISVLAWMIGRPNLTLLMVFLAPETSSLDASPFLC
jgi:hypothetical protein